MGESYAEIVVALRNAGTPIPTNDIWIAAAAMVTNSKVLTYDPHFNVMSQVRTVVLPVPSKQG